MTIKRYTEAFHEMAGCFMQDHPEGEYVKWEDVEKLAAENMVIKAMNDGLSEELRGYESDGAFDGPNMHKLWYSHSDALPATDALANQLRAEGIHFVANRMLAAWESGFIDDTPEQAFDISGAVLSALEFLPNASPDEFKCDYADEVRSAIAAQLRDKGGNNG